MSTKPVADPCVPPLDGPTLLTFSDRIVKGPQIFKFTPGLVAILAGFLLSGVYWTIFYFMYKGQTFTDDDAKKKYITEGIVGYLLTVIPLCLGLYAWRISKFVQLNYSLYYPNATWHGGIFWGSAILLLLLCIVVGVILIQYWGGDHLSAFWISSLSVMSVALSVVCGALAEVVVDWKLSPDPKYAAQFRCAEKQLINNVAELAKQNQIRAAAAAQTIQETSAISKALNTQPNATTNSRSAAQLVSSNPANIGEGVSRIATTSSRPPAPPTPAASSTFPFPWPLPGSDFSGSSNTTSSSGH